MAVTYTTSLDADTTALRIAKDGALLHYSWHKNNPDYVVVEADTTPITLSVGEFRQALLEFRQWLTMLVKNYVVTILPETEIKVEKEKNSFGSEMAFVRNGVSVNLDYNAQESTVKIKYSDVPNFPSITSLMHGNYEVSHWTSLNFEPFERTISEIPSKILLDWMVTI